MTSLDHIPFVDLAAQHSEIVDEVGLGFSSIMGDSSFINGPAVARFEREWSEYCGGGHAVGVASGTDALELALRALGVGPGDEVVVPVNSFIASAGAVARAGARPVFVDCDDDHLLLDPKAVAAALGSATKALMPVHLYGQLAPMEQLCDLAEASELSVIEDAAQAHGASQDGRRAGQWGSIAATSFYPGKNLGAYGDGGAVMTRSPVLADAVMALRNHGDAVRYDHPTLGFNSRLDSLQAVVLSAKLRRLDGWNQARRRAADRYHRLLSDLPGLRLPRVAPGNEPVWHLYVIRVSERDEIVGALQKHGIGVGIHYPVPLHLTGAFAYLDYRRGQFPVAERAATEIVSLPMHPHLTESQQTRVAEVLATVLR